MIRLPDGRIFAYDPIVKTDTDSQLVLPKIMHEWQQARVIARIKRDGPNMESSMKCHRLDKLTSKCMTEDDDNRFITLTDDNNDNGEEYLRRLHGRMRWCQTEGDLRSTNNDRNNI